MERHYGMDWLRIGAFGLLIFYHIGMVFVPWGFHVKTAHPMDWVEIPMFLTNPWRLTLLFVISGYASRALFGKSGSVSRFMRDRSIRLLVPLLFGMAVLVPVQAWIDLTFHGHYRQGFWWFVAHDYFAFRTIAGIWLPNWYHLWFVAYLWAYTAGLALLLCVPGTARLQGLFDRVFGGWRALALPMLYFVVLEAWWFEGQLDDTHDLIHDGIAHLRYVPAFLFGFGLARSRAAMDGLVAWRHGAAAIALLSFAAIAAGLALHPDFTFPSRSWTHVYEHAHGLETWTGIAALIGFAETHWNRDHRWRQTMAEATFPFYMIHQTIIVGVGYALFGLPWGPLAEFLILVAATVTGCWAFYLIGRRVNWLRPLIGLKRLSRAPASAKARSHELDIDDSRRRGLDEARSPA